jgi:hypothetical protein
MPRRFAAAPLLLLIALGTGGACTATPAATSGTPTPPISIPTASPPIETAGAETPAETAPVGTPAETELVPTAPAATSAVSFDPDEALEEMFPDDIGGVPLEVSSATGEGVLTFMGDSDPERVGAFLGAFGKTIEDASAAFAFSFVPGETATDIGGITILGLRVSGVPADQLVDGFTGLVTAETPDAEVSEATISGKSVTVVADPTESPDDAVTLYGVGDVVFVVGGTPELVEEALAELP